MKVYIVGEISLLLLLVVLSSSFTCLQELLTFVINIIKFYFDVSSLLIWNLYTLVNLRAFDFISCVLLIRSVFWYK